MSVTIKDVAKQANVSPSTVSRVISDSDRISDKTKRKVRKVMEELGYHINVNGRVLVRQSTETIGIVMKGSSSHSLDNPFFFELLRGISNACHQHHYHLQITTGDSEEAIFQDVVNMVQGKRVDGIIVLYSKDDDKVAPYLVEQGFPFVMIGKPLFHSNNVMYVDNDNVAASKEVTEYLIQLGHKRIGFVGGDFHFEVATARLEGYKQAHRANGLHVDHRYIQPIQLNRSNADKVVTELLALSQPPTAFVVTDDYNALSVMQSLQAHGQQVPRDVSVVGFNNTIISKLSSPTITTVDTQSYQLGFASANNIIELLTKPDMVKRSTIIPTQIIKRDSCKSIN
ncbi:LacI family DNA-binding transcriptional regulator [Pontibacillus litoralis]|uniref:LacI family transcription regulator n=1 Tax=Pontibacillus litoralis JSM 072002 TaxID=1385512 RepID=A0A0A5G3T6_9BACI|nr:LacI family DNA-binding transcriptional regulator [Pontibacillus litoralis]KGX87786.1 LacI family transcription regulator [Pontibacillus litoralis JSM 072002]